MGRRVWVGPSVSPRVRAGTKEIPDVSKNMQVELDPIKMAVNENTGLLDHLLTHLDVTQNATQNSSNASMQNILSNPPLH